MSCRLLALALAIIPCCLLRADSGAHPTSATAQRHSEPAQEGWGRTFELLPDEALLLPNQIEEWFDAAGSVGVQPFFNYWATWQANPVGGEAQGSAYAHETLWGVTLDLDTLVGWNGASLQVSGSANAGSNLSETVGNINNISEAVVTPTVLFYELYYAQKWHSIETRIGRMVAADWFASLPAFGIQVQGGINGNPTSLFVNSNFTSSPNATWAGMIRWNPTDDTYLIGGIFQAKNRLGKVAYHGLDFSIREEDGVLLMWEAAWEPTLGKQESPSRAGRASDKSALVTNPGLPGHYKFGAYFSTLPYDGFLGGSQQNTYGFYWMAQQMVWRNQSNPNFNVELWGGLTYAPQSDVALLPLMGMTGVIVQGLIPLRPNDQLLGTYLISAFSSDYATSVAREGGGRPTAESVFDFSYIINLTDNLFIQPDLQYIIRPNGTGTANALVLGLQFGATF